MSPRLSAFASENYRIHLQCMKPGCPYGGRTFEAADLLEKHGDITLEDLKARAACGEWIKRRAEDPTQPRHTIMVEVSPPAIEGMGGFTDRDRR